MKQPDSLALAAGITWVEARKTEREFFESTEAWAELEYEFQGRLGTANLTRCLSDILTDLIAKRFVPGFVFHIRQRMLILRA